MFFIKAFLVGLLAGSLCMANITGSSCMVNISGIVTDTSGTIPISGAVVQLEKGGLTGCWLHVAGC